MTVHRDDLESKLREIESVVTDTQTAAQKRTKMLIAGAAVIAVGYIAFRIWRGRQDRHGKIRVEVYHQP